MKTFVFTYDRYNKITTSEYLKDIPHIVLCHTEEQKQKFIDGGRVYGELIASGQPKGLAYNRNFALNMLEDGEWACFWVDDLVDVTYLKNYWDINEQDSIGVNSENQPQIRQDFKEKCSPEMFYRIAEDTIKKAEQKGFALCGFTLTDNPLFRDKHYSNWSLSDGRCVLVKKTKLLYDTNVHTIDDYCFTTLNLKMFGGVVNNNWLLPLCERYTSGGYGSIEERLQQKKDDCKYLVENFPDYICYGEKVGQPPLSHVKIRQKKIDKDQVTLF
jgi:hypothetical protein